LCLQLKNFSKAITTKRALSNATENEV